MNLVASALTAIACSLGCSSATTNAALPFAIELRAVSQDGAALPGVSFTIDRNGVGTTNAEGRLVRQVTGTEGSSLKIAAACPPDFEPPEQPEPLRLTRTRAVAAAATQPLTLEVRCQKRWSDIAVIVHAERGQRLPLLVDGKPVATLDDDGIAHLLLRRPRTGKSVQIGLDTTERPMLKPVSPTRSYELHGRDAVVVFEPSFVVTTAIAARAAAPRRRIPVRVD